MTKNLLSLISIFSLIAISHTSLADKSYDKTNLLTCSAYHFKEKLNSQYSAEKKYNYLGFHSVQTLVFTVIFQKVSEHTQEHLVVLQEFLVNM